jgi:hypothetical protein
VGDLEGDLGLASRPTNISLVGGQPVSCAVRTCDGLDKALEFDLEAWLAWVKAARDTRHDNRAMRRLALVYGVGWAAVCAATLAIPLVGVAAALLGMVFLVGTLVLAFVVTAWEPDDPDQSSGPVDTWTAWSAWGPAEQTRLLRIINLSRVASRPAGANLLLSELDDALAAEPLASWLPSRTLRAIVQTGGSRLMPFGTERHLR